MPTRCFSHGVVAICWIDVHDMEDLGGFGCGEEDAVKRSLGLGYSALNFTPGNASDD